MHLSILAFLQRINYPLPQSSSLPPPTLDTLFTLHKCIQTTIPYENFSVFHPPTWSLKSGWFDKADGPSLRETRPIRIDVKSVYKKMVERRRGGFCLEINMIYAWALESLGYTVQKRSGKIITGFNNDTLPGANRPDSHLLLLITLPTPQPPLPPHLSHFSPPPPRWLCDTGAADRSPLTPLPLLDGHTGGISGGLSISLKSNTTWCDRQGWMYLNSSADETSEKRGYRHFCFFEDVDVEDEVFEETCPPVPGSTEFATVTGREGEKVMLIGKEVGVDGGKGVLYKVLVRDAKGVEVERVEFGGEGREKDWVRCQEVLKERFGIWGFSEDV
ncbi:hypothetical protein BC829DRAFT_437367 [Chytridium lagenaria]|nr:hypothetical protein BC829DRAFT_437367 [Chytridium lagenaria]